MSIENQYHIQAPGCKPAIAAFARRRLQYGTRRWDDVAHELTIRQVPEADALPGVGRLLCASLVPLLDQQVELLLDALL